MTVRFSSLGEFSYPLLRESNFCVYCVRLDVETIAPQEAYSLLTKEEQEKASRLIHQRHRDHFVLLHAFLHVQLAEALGIDPAAVKFAYGANGKPQLSAEHNSDLHFNISRSVNYGLVAISSAHEIGVDIETPRPIEDAEALLIRFGSPHERAEYAGIPEAEKLTAFYRWWTRKEALVKGLGYGLSFSLSDFDVSLAPSKPAKVLRVGAQLNEDVTWQLYDISRTPQFIAAVAVDNHR